MKFNQRSIQHRIEWNINSTYIRFNLSLELNVGFRTYLNWCLFKYTTMKSSNHQLQILLDVLSNEYPSFKIPKWEIAKIHKSPQHLNSQPATPDSTFQRAFVLCGIAIHRMIFQLSLQGHSFDVVETPRSYWARRRGAWTKTGSGTGRIRSRSVCFAWIRHDTNLESNLPMPSWSKIGEFLCLPFAST